jgi:hypothetical protein
MDQIQQNNSTLSAVSGALEEDRYYNYSFIPRKASLISANYSPGFYTVRGVTYLEGAKFEDKLVNGVNCEVFIEVNNIKIYPINWQVFYFCLHFLDRNWMNGCL